jgi:hypothetical protein
MATVVVVTTVVLVVAVVVVLARQGPTGRLSEERSIPERRADSQVRARWVEHASGQR